MATKNGDGAKEVEELLQATRQHEEAAKVSAAKAGETQSQVAAMLAEIQSKTSDITTSATEATAARTKINDAQAVIATKSKHIEDAQAHADKVREGLDNKVTEINQKATEAEGFKAKTQSASEQATTALTETRTAKGSAETDAAAATEARKKAEESAAVSKQLADKAEEVETRLAEYEKQLAELKEQSETRAKTIDSLLPGATSAGLAHAFNERRKTFLKPQNRWQWIFVGSLIVIATLGVTGLWQFYHLGKVPTYDELGRLWLGRLPVAGVLLWLAVHASRESALAKRLEEDYGYKSAVASCFEGFRQQMADINAAPESALGKLCSDTLTTIATPPGRIYDKHKLTFSPVDELKECTKLLGETVKPIVDLAKKLKVPIS